jgi:hypothetical protein
MYSSVHAVQIPYVFQSSSTYAAFLLFINCDMSGTK